MPELPEVETIRRGLEEKLVGRRLTGLEVRVAKLFSGDPEQIIGQKITRLARLGKLLVIYLENGLVITVHLKMTGQLIWQSQKETVMGGHPEKSYLQPLPHKHTHLIFQFDDRSTLYFNDLRKFGRVTVLKASELNQVNFVQKLGPEPLSKNFTKAYLAEQLKKHAKQPIKTFLLDQSNLAGLGNIYADESLFRAAILPTRPAADLKPGEVGNLFDSIQETLELALLHGGSSSRDYLNAVGDRGTFLKIANVYHRTGQDCNRCGSPIVRIKLGGRSTHYCSICQR